MTTSDPPPPAPTEKINVKKEVEKSSLDVDMTVEPMPVVTNKIPCETDSDNNSDKENMVPKKKKVRKTVKKRKEKMEEKKTRGEKDEREGKGKKRLEEVIGKIKFQNVSAKRQSTRISLPQDNSQSTQETNISVNDVLDVLCSSDKWAGADIFFTPPSGNWSDEDSASSEDEDGLLHHLSRNQLIAPCELQVKILIVFKQM